MVKHFSFSGISLCVFASPGFYNQSLLQFITEKYQLYTGSDPLRALYDNRSKIVLIHVPHGYLSSLEGILSDKSIQKQLDFSTFSIEKTAIDRFMLTLSKSPNRAYYSLEYVQYAAELGAIKELLISTELFRLYIYSNHLDLVRMLTKGKHC